MLLGRIGEPAAGAVPVLLRLRSGDDRYWALKSLGLFGEVAADAVDQLAPELHDSSREPSDRILVADVLGQIGTGPAIEALGRELLRSSRTFSQDSSTDVAESRLLTKTMLDAISLAGPKAVGALPAIVRSLENPESEIRRKACQAIGQLGPQAEPAIDSIFERLVLDDSPEVQDAAAQALGQLGRSSVPLLLRVVRDAPPNLQWRAARTFGRFGSTWTGTRIDPRRELGEDRAVIVQELVALFQSEDSRVRIESLESVWRIDRQAGPVADALIKELGSVERQVRMAAIRVLVEIEELPDEARVSLNKLSVESSLEGRSAREVLRKRLRRRQE
jgi:HEAT repeat protein